MPDRKHSDVLLHDSSKCWMPYFAGVVDALKADIILKDNMLKRMSEENSKLRTFVNQYKNAHQTPAPKNTSQSTTSQSHASHGSRGHHVTIAAEAKPKPKKLSLADVAKRRGTPFARKPSVMSDDSEESEGDSPNYFGARAPSAAGLLLHAQPGAKGGVHFQVAAAKRIMNPPQNPFKRDAPTVNSSQNVKHTTYTARNGIVNADSSNQSQSTLLPPLNTLSKKQTVGFKIGNGNSTHRSKDKGNFGRKNSHHSMQVGATEISAYNNPMTITEANYLKAKSYNDPAPGRKKGGKVIEIHTMAKGARQPKALGIFGRQKSYAQFDMRKISFLQ